MVRWTFPFSSFHVHSPQGHRIGSSSVSRRSTLWQSGHLRIHSLIGRLPIPRPRLVGILARFGQDHRPSDLKWRHSPRRKPPDQLTLAPFIPRKEVYGLMSSVSPVLFQEGCAEQDPELWRPILDGHRIVLTRTCHTTHQIPEVSSVQKTTSLEGDGPNSVIPAR